MEQFGCYQVGDLKFFSKLEATQAHDSLGLPIHWNFNEAVFSSYNWQVEPTESLDELYRRRAQQIRDKYDYLVLWFSGGADSNNVLNSFIDNDIKIDECVSLVNYAATGDKHNFLNGEIFNVAAPKIEQARLKQPHLIHRLVDLSQITIDHFTQKDTKFDWIYHMNGYLNANNASKQDIKLKVKEWADMINAGKKVGFIHGIDKPRITQVKDNYYFMFVDLVDTAVSGNIQMLNRPWEFDELFYWTPDMPELVIKQAHVVKKFVAGLLADSNCLGNSAETVVVVRDGKKLYLKLDPMHRLIYPGWYPVPYQAKAPSLFFTPRDEWFYALPDSDPAKYAWMTGLKEIWTKFPDKWKRDPSDIRKGFIPFFSKRYNLGK